LHSLRLPRIRIAVGVVQLFALATAAAPGVASAQSAAPAGATPAAAAGPALETIVVTAQRRSQSAQQVGVALSVLSGDELAARGVRKVNQLQNEVPNLEVEPAFGGSQAQFRLRGVGFQDYATNNAGAVTVYVDEVALPLPVQTQGLLFDLERVEVLRGPQGTLYGRNTTGGAVNFLTRKPSKAFEAGLNLGLASFGEKSAEAYVSGPLSESLRGRVSLATQQGGAWQKSRDTGAKLGDKDVFGLRAQLELDATRDLKFNLSVNSGRDTSEGQGLYLFVAQPAVPGYPVPKAALPADRDRRLAGWGFAPAFLARYGQPADARPGRDNDSSGASLTVNWTLGGLRLTSITASDRFQRRELADYDGTSLPLAETWFDSRSRNTSQELRLANADAGAALNWVAGVYAANERLDEIYASSFANSFGFPIVQTSYGQKVRTRSVFGQVDWRLLESLKLVAGLRQEKEDRERLNFATASLAPPIPFSGPSSGSFGHDETSGKLGLEWQPSRALLGYASVSRGVKSGGFTAYNTFNETALTPFKPEVLVAYEVGFKADPSPALRINAALFHYDYRDMQILDAILDPATGATVGKIVNAPKSRIDGIEIELAWKPSSALTLTQFVGYKDGKFKQYRALSPAADLAGQPLYFPRLSYGLGATYRFELGGYGVAVQADAAYRDKGRSFLNRINPAYDFNTPAYWLANARLEFAPLKGAWRATVFARNLFDKEYDLTRNFFDLPLPAAAAGAPRTLGVNVAFEF
jgi:outer membrane receptor protein involved in Fe transport